MCVYIVLLTVEALCTSCLILAVNVSDATALNFSEDATKLMKVVLESKLFRPGAVRTMTLCFAGFNKI